tara:strand:- start:523 stop:687 length:165 start_codon:yes stop_codon:yes gene_type:complete
LILNKPFVKRVLSCLAVLIFLGCGSRYQWFDGTFEEAKLVAGSKIILLKFYTYT